MTGSAEQPSVVRDADPSAEAASTPTRRARPQWLGFAFSVAALVACFAGSSSVIPLYNLYRAENGLTNADVSLTVVTYFVGTMSALLIFGRISNHIGRRRTAAIALLLVAAGCLALLDVNSAAQVMFGRLLMGLGCGIASSGVMAYIVDTAPVRPMWVASVATSQSPLIGLTIGGIGAGALIEWGPNPRVSVYLTVLALIALCLLGLLISPETIDRRPGVLRSLRPRVQIPDQPRRVLWVAFAIFLSTWAAGGYFQSFSSTITQDQLGTNHAVVMALVYASYMAPSVLGASIGGRFAAVTAQRVGMALFFAGMTVLLIGLATESVVLVIGGGCVAGFGQGMASAATLRILLNGLEQQHRAPVLAATYLVSYGGAMVVSLIAGQFSKNYGIVPITGGYVVLAVLATAATVFAARNARG